MAILIANSTLQRLDLSHLKHFYSVASFSGFSSASRATGVSQPALSLGLQKLEKTLGVQLIDRGDRKFALTHEGQALYTLCQRIEASLDATLDSFNSAENASTRRLRIGTALSIGFGPLAALCKANRNSPVRVEIEMATQNTFLLLDQVAEGKLDAALVPDDVYDSRLKLKRLWRERLVFVVAGHVPVEFAKKDWKEWLKSLPLVTYPRETPIRMLIDQFVTSQKIDFSSLFTADSVDAVKLLVAGGSGGAFVLRSLITEEVRAQALREVLLPVELPRSGVSLCTRGGERGDAISKKIIQELS